MPAKQPFTALCQAAARSPHADRADLHVHTTHSDGLYTPAQVIDLARRAGLAAVAITDHDTLAGCAEATQAAGSALEVVPAVEISAVHHEREVHVLGYFLRLDHTPLVLALTALRKARAERFRLMIERLRARGIELPAGVEQSEDTERSLGRRYLAELLVKEGRARSTRDAFQSLLGDQGPIALPKERLQVGNACALIRAAGGVASWAHPSYDCTKELVLEFKEMGLGALEAVYPGHKGARERELRALAAEAGLLITGGSDCHGPEPLRRAIGSYSITRAELEQLRRRASC
jgi:predicted metal-dependent phosphoesterase TrpH